MSIAATLSAVKNTMSQDKNTLPKPPLVEALLEIQWKLQEVVPGVSRDPYFDVAHVRLYEQVKARFNVIEPLDALNVPNELTPHIVKYRYRVERDRWPLIQVGPGIATLNFTDPYDWTTFLSEAKQFLSDLLNAYEDTTLVIRSIELRYINAERFDAPQDELLEFLRRKLNTVFEPPIRVNSEHTQRLNGANWVLQYRLAKPAGLGILRFTTGNYNNVESIIWEQGVRSEGQDCPQPDRASNSGVADWLRDAHTVIEDWFLDIVKGDLLQKYKDE